MFEGPDQNLKKEWDKKLKEAGLPSTVRRQKIPVLNEPNLSAKEVFKKFVLNTEEFLEKFEALSPKIQEDILTDVKDKRSKMSPQEILDRIEILLAKGGELERMTADDSDKTHHQPEPSREYSEDDDEATRRIVDKFIERAEQIRKRDNFIPKGVDKYLN